LAKPHEESAPAAVPGAPAEERLPFRAPAWARSRAASPTPTPPPAAEGVLGTLWNAWSAPDPQAIVRDAVASAVASLAAGHGEEPAWYVLLRGLEMLDAHGPVDVGAAQHPSLLAAAEAQHRTFHASPRLATVRAREDRGVAAARAALKVNPAYAPAQVALGRALLREGKAAAARAVLEAVAEPERVQGGAVALARALVETGDPEKGLLAAARETNAPGPYGVEPSICDPAIGREVDEVQGLARLCVGAVEAGARALLLATVRGSGRARRALAQHAGRKDVRSALDRLSHDMALPPHVRALAAILAR
jgi:hypothetical protein